MLIEAPTSDANYHYETLVVDELQQKHPFLRDEGLTTAVFW
jgi:hypothetical protein